MVTFVVIFALIACLIGSLIVSRSVRLIEYTSNRRCTGFSNILFTILGSLIGGWMFFGLCSVGYDAGVVGYAIGIGYCLGLILIALAIPRINKAMVNENCDTMDDFVGVRYGKSAQLCVTAINFMLFTAVLAAQFIALSAFLRVFVEIESSLSFYIAVAVVLTYTALAGFKGVLFTDMWQFYILSASVVVIFILLTVNTDLSMITALDPIYFNGMSYGSAFLVGVFILFPPSLLVRTDMWQRIAAAKDIREAQRAFYISAPILLAYYVMLTTVGIYSRAALGEGIQAETSGFVYFLYVIRGPSEEILTLGASIFLIILALGVFAALLSTADTYLNVVAVALSKLLKHKDWQRFEDETPDKIKGSRTKVEQNLLYTVRIVTLLLGIVAFGMAKLIPDIVNLILAAGGAIMIFLPTVLMALFRGAHNTKASIASIACGFFIFLAFLSIAPRVAFCPAFLISFVTYLIIDVLFRF